MKIFDLIRTSFYGIKSHKLRSVLTTLGIIIGVGTVISMMSIIEGINGYVYKQFGAVGSDVIYVQKYKWGVFIGKAEAGWWKKFKEYPNFTKKDAEDIEKLDYVDRTSVELVLYTLNSVKFKGKSLENITVRAVTPGYFDISGYEIEVGRTLNEDDEFFRRNVCVVGKYIVENLFEGENPVGKEIKIGNKKFLVVGVLKKRGEIFGQSLDDVVLIPFSKGKQIAGKPRVEWQKVFMTPIIHVKVKKGHNLEEVMEKLRKFLRKRRKLFFTDEDNFALQTQEMLLSIYRSITGGIFAAMIGIASLALIVGGIGIMNIMLVSVSERTKEIGIRMAVGAKRRDILYQFLLESIFLTGVGGVLGFLLGVIIGKLVDILTPLPSHIPLWSVLLAIAFSSVIGIFFGIYPATQAAKKDPIECLRYE